MPRPARAIKPQAIDTLDERLKALVVGQDEAIDRILPYISMYQSGLHIYEQPIGAFILSGMTASGKTHMVSSLAQALHGSNKSLLRIDCAEYQHSHEIAKLIGAPPGYLGHRETQPVLTQAKVNSITSERSSVSIVLFDEIEKANSAFHQILLGILDRGILKLGDNNIVNFERSLIFMTTNLGQKDLLQQMAGYGFVLPTGATQEVNKTKLDANVTRHIKKAFSAEFQNRITEFITFNPLTHEDQRKIVQLELTKFLDATVVKIMELVDLDDTVYDLILRVGFDPVFGARALKRSIHKNLIVPFALWLQDEPAVVKRCGIIKVGVNSDDKVYFVRET